MNRIIIPILALAVYAGETEVLASSNQPNAASKIEKTDEHGHAHGEAEDHKDDHSDAEGHEEEGEEAGGNVGPDKGILAASKNEGFKLSPEAFKNFDLRFVTVTMSSAAILPPSALVFSGEEVNVYRLRNGFFKRIDFKLQKKSEKEISISSPDLANGDQVAVAGLGFLRIAELTAFGGAPEGHSH